MSAGSNPPPAKQGGKRRTSWTPEQVIQVFKEVVTALLGLMLVGYTLILANNAYAFVGDNQKMSDAKDVLLIMQGLAGVVIGYYFGRVPADARATQAQQQADTATAQAEQVSAKAQQAADTVERIMARAAAPGDGAARGTGGGAMPADVTSELRRVRDELREMARMGR